MLVDNGYLTIYLVIGSYYQQIIHVNPRIGRKRPKSDGISLNPAINNNSTYMLLEYSLPQL
jgi:hypothetical protein